MPSLEKPVLIADDEIVGHPNAFGYPVDVWEEAIKRKTTDPNYRDGVFEAAELLLKEAAVEISFVDIDTPGSPICEGEEELYKGPSMVLGYNDHGGGSESGYKILLNCLFDKKEGSYVLYSPPTSEGLPTNLTFHRADFTFITLEPEGLWNDGVPNPLKTAGATGHMSRRSYRYYIVGDETAPRRLPEVFRASGFSFVDQPYEPDGDELRRINQSAESSDNENQYPSVKHWPLDQFAGQIATLKSIEQT